MKLQSLSQKSQRVAETVLVELTEGFLPNAFEEVKADPFNPVNYSEVLSEIKQKAGISENDRSDIAKYKILETLSNELSNLILTDARKARAKSRLEYRQLNSQDQLSVHFPERAFPFFKSTGIEEREVVEAIHSPDQLQYFFEKSDKGTGYAEGVGVCVKIKPNSNTGEPYYFLVIFDRKGLDAACLAAWRIFRQDVGFDDSEKPMKIFLKFLDKFAFTISTANSPRTKFILLDTWNYNIDNPNDDVTVHNPAGRIEFFRSTIMRGSPLNLIVVSFVYVVDAAKYRMSLKDHGFGQPGPVL